MGNQGSNQHKQSNTTTDEKIDHSSEPQPSEMVDQKSTPNEINADGHNVNHQNTQSVTTKEPKSTTDSTNNYVVIHPLGDRTKTLDPSQPEEQMQQRHIPSTENRKQTSQHAPTRDIDSSDINAHLSLFDQLIQFNDFRELFTRYITDTHSQYATMISFLHRVEQFHSQTLPSVRYALAKDIIHEYIRDGSSKRLFFRSEVGNAVRKRLIEQFDEYCSERVIPSRLFDDVVRSVYSELKQGPYASFVRTENFRRYVQEKEKSG